MPRAASPSRNICETSPVTGTGRCIGNVVAICTASRIPSLREVLVQEERSLERRRRTLERLPEHRDEDAPAVELGQRVAQTLGPGQRVVLVAALLEARRGRHVVVRAHGHDQEVGVVDAGVGGHPPRDRIDADDPLLTELDAVLRDVAIRDPHRVGRLAAEHHLELGEAEMERVVAVEQRDANRVRNRLGRVASPVRARRNRRRGSGRVASWWRGPTDPAVSDGLRQRRHAPRIGGRSDRRPARPGAAPTRRAGGSSPRPAGSAGSGVR